MAGIIIAVIVSMMMLKVHEQKWSAIGFATHAHIGYLLTCPRTVAWRGSVQVPGSSLSHRLPALVAWLSFGLRGPGAVGRERLKRGLLSSK
jgi:hypothetical protein